MCPNKQECNTYITTGNHNHSRLLLQCRFYCHFGPVGINLSVSEFCTLGTNLIACITHQQELSCSKPSVCTVSAIFASGIFQVRCEAIGHTLVVWFPGATRTAVIQVVIFQVCKHQGINGRHLCLMLFTINSKDIRIQVEMKMTNSVPHALYR